MKSDEYYSLTEILKRNALYNVIFGERSNGKTYSVLDYALQDFFKTGKTLGIIRRWDEDYTGANGMKTCYNSLIFNGKGENKIREYSKGKYSGVTYYAGKYYFTVYDEKTQQDVKTPVVVAHAFSLTGAEHYKSASFPDIGTVLFDEFMTRKYYLPNEFIDFQNLLSTILRGGNENRPVKIFMCGNTVDKYGCPYFSEMGLYRISEMKKTDIDVYSYGESGLTVAVEYSDSPKKRKFSDRYFAFENPSLKMITSGNWELGIYPHLPEKYAPKDIRFTFFIRTEKAILQCEIIDKNGVFCYIHRKTGEIKNPERDIVIQKEESNRPNIYTRISQPHGRLGEKIFKLFKYNRVFYQDNEVGEMVYKFRQQTEKVKG